MESSDFELLDRWGAGDHEAGRQLFELHFEALHRFFAGKVEDWLEELMEWTLLGCVQSRAQARREAGFRSYLFRLARFQVHAHYREHHTPPIDLARLALADLGHTASHMTLRKEGDGETLFEAMHHTPVDDHIALELMFREGLSSAELAVVFECSVRAAVTRLHRATERLRAELQAAARRPFSTSDALHALEQLAPAAEGSACRSLDVR